MNNTNQDQPKKKDSEAMKAALLSAFVLPGLGQMYNRQWGKGLFVAFTFLLSSLGVLIPVTIGVASYYIAAAQADLEKASAALDPIKNVWIHLIVLTVLSVILYIYSIVDSYKTRKKKDWS
jgi:TM2 domain-containing membrane protein YozV